MVLSSADCLTAFLQGADIIGGKTIYYKTRDKILYQTAR